MAKVAPPSRRVRIFMFNKREWIKTFPQMPKLAPLPPHFTIIEPPPLIVRAVGVIGDEAAHGQPRPLVLIASTPATASKSSAGGKLVGSIGHGSSRTEASQAYPVLGLEPSF
jgi:hypothetical protein